MNIKGKHLKLARFVRDNYAVTEGEAVEAGFELSMIKSLSNKGVLAGLNRNNRLYVTVETQNKIRE